MTTVLDWISNNFGFIATGWGWTWPIAETLHFFGLCLLLGGLLVIDLRLLGVVRGVSAKTVHALIPFAIGGFVINLITGLIFVVGDPHRYAPNVAFQIKMLLVLLAGVNALWYQLKVAPVIDTWPNDADPPREAKLMGAFSLVIWFGVLGYGRLIPYLGTG